MNMEHSRVAETLVVKLLEARFGADGAPAFKKQMGSLMKEGHGRIVLDLSEVDFLDSTGLGAIVWVLKSLGPSGSLSICGANRTLTRMFELTRMDKILNLYPDVEASVASLAT